MTTPGGRDPAERQGLGGADACAARRRLDGKFVADKRRLLPHRARRADRREGGGVAAVHHRRAGRSAADGVDSRSRGATRRRRRSRRCSSRRAPKTTTASRISSSVYSVNGGAEKTLRLFDGKNRLTRGHGGAHVLPRGAQRRSRAISFPTTRAPPTTTPSPAPRSTTSDLYFLQIRPLRKEFKRAESQRRRWRRGRRQPAGWRVVAAAASDHRGDVQHQPRPQDDGGRQVARELDRHRAVAGEAARPGGGPGDADEQPPDPAGPGLQEGCASCCRRQSPR